MHTLVAFIFYLIEKTVIATRRRDIESYLAQSYDVYDLEHRINALARKGIL